MRRAGELGILCVGLMLFIVMAVIRYRGRAL